MRESKSQRHLSVNRKNRAVPLAKLQASEAVRTVVAHPRRMAELLRLLEDSDQMTRRRVASAFARLADACPERLVRWVDRIQEALADDSAYVRWQLVYVLGRVSARYPGRVKAQLEALIRALEDENKVVRVLSLRALAGMASVRPRAVQEAFAVQKREVPAGLARILRGARPAAKLPRKR